MKATDRRYWSKIIKTIFDESLSPHIPAVCLFGMAWAAQSLLGKIIMYNYCVSAAITFISTANTISALIKHKEEATETKKRDAHICSAFLFLCPVSCRIMCVYNGAQGGRLKTKHCNKMNIHSFICINSRLNPPTYYAATGSYSALTPS